MEIESEEGERIAVDMDTEREIGRCLGSLGFRHPSAGDRTVSRRHLSLRLAGELNGDPRGELWASFEVVGRNPILVLPAGHAADARVYRNSEKGELRDGDQFSISLANPSFWVVKRSGEGRRDEEVVDQRVLDAVERREKRTQERRKAKEMKDREEEEEKKRTMEMDEAREVEEGDVNGEGECDFSAHDISSIDPVQDFGFLVKGHEFDQYPRQRIRPPKKWNWFLDEPRGRSDDEDGLTDEEGTSSKKSQKRKKKGEANEDEEWTGESEDEKGNSEEIQTNRRRSKYSTRSQDPKRPRRDDTAGRHKPLDDRDVKLKHQRVGDYNGHEDETLGGFIVDDVDEEAGVEELDAEDEAEFDEEEDDE